MRGQGHSSAAQVPAWQVQDCEFAPWYQHKNQKPKKPNMRRTYESLFFFFLKEIKIAGQLLGSQWLQ